MTLEISWSNETRELRLQKGKNLQKISFPSTALFTLEVSADSKHRQEAENLGMVSEKLAELWVETCRPAKHKTSFFGSTSAKYWGSLEFEATNLSRKPQKNQRRDIFSSFERQSLRFGTCQGKWALQNTQGSQLKILENQGQTIGMLQLFRTTNQPQLCVTAVCLRWSAKTPPA